MILLKYFKRNQISKAKLISYYQDVFKSPQGRIVLADLCKICRIDQPTFSNDALEMARREGERRVALHILNSLSISPAEYLLKINGEVE